MLSVCLVMLFSRMDKILDYPIPWRIFTQMCLGGAFTMDVLYRECGKKLRLSPSKFFVQYGYISLFLSLSLLKNSPSVVLYSPLAIDFLICISCVNLEPELMFVQIYLKLVN